jgi:hypothetical protein
LAIFVGGAVIVGFTAFPSATEALPKQVQRTLSILVLKQGATAIQQELAAASGTNEWHEELRRIAWSRWTANPRNFLFGTGLQSFDYTALQGVSATEEFQLTMENAANVGAYECAFWQTVATFGLAGLLLYAWLLLSLTRAILRLTDAAVQDPFGRTFLFLGVALPLELAVFSMLTGTTPSLELVLIGAGLFYLRDQIREREEAEEEEALTKTASFPATAYQP